MNKFGQLARVEKLFHHFKPLSLVYTLYQLHLELVRDIILELRKCVSLEGIGVLDGRDRDVLILSRLTYIEGLFKVSVLNISERAELQVDPHLDVGASKKECLDKLRIILPVQPTIHQVDHQDAVLVHPLKISGVPTHLLHGLLVPLLDLVLRESLAFEPLHILSVHFSEGGGSVLQCVVDSQSVFS